MPLGDQGPLHGGARERLRREQDPGARPASRQRLSVLLGPGTQDVLRHHHHRRAELGRQIVGAAATHDEHAVGIGRRSGREQSEQVRGIHAHSGHGSPVPGRRRRPPSPALPDSGHYAAVP